MQPWCRVCRVCRTLGGNLAPDRFDMRWSPARPRKALQRPLHGALQAAAGATSLERLNPVRPVPQAQATLSDGRVFAIGGSWNGGYSGQNGIPIKNGEVRRSQSTGCLGAGHTVSDPAHRHPSCTSPAGLSRLKQTHRPCRREHN